jgi:hypothetical protein
MKSSEVRDKITAHAETIQAAAQVLIGTVRNAKNDNGVRSNFGEFELEVEMTESGTELWKITVERISAVQ